MDKPLWKHLNVKKKKNIYIYRRTHTLMPILEQIGKDTDYPLRKLQKFTLILRKREK